MIATTFEECDGLKLRAITMLLAGVGVLACASEAEAARRDPFKTGLRIAQWRGYDVAQAHCFAQAFSESAYLNRYGRYAVRLGRRRGPSPFYIGLHTRCGISL